jgi:hypothetical protein
MQSGRAIDHVVIAGRDLDALAARYEGLGFTLTPEAHHEDRMGTSNRLAQFRGRNFIELIEVDRPETVEQPAPGGFAFGAFLKRYLARREGLAMIVFRSQDARADVAAWREHGVDTYEPFDFQRQARLPDGTEATVGFSLGFATSPEMPELAFFVCQNRAEEHFWKPAYQEHANGAEEIAAVLLVARDPARHGAFLARLFDGAVTGRPGGVSVACGPHRIDIVEPEALPGWQGDPGDGALGAGLALRVPARAGATRPAAEAGNVAIEWVS